MKKILWLCVALTLSACGEKNDDLKEFVRNSGKGLRGKVEPLPEVKPFVPFDYDAFELPDPFKPRKLKPSGGGVNQPDVKRPREALENFPLENLKMVGVIQQKKDFFGIVRSPDNSLYRVKVGNYLGQNYGKVVTINNNEIKLKELVQDSAGDWIERETSIQLQETQETKK